MIEKKRKKSLFYPKTINELSPLLVSNIYVNLS